MMQNSSGCERIFYFIFIFFKGNKEFLFRSFGRYPEVPLAKNLGLMLSSCLPCLMYFVHQTTNLPAEHITFSHEPPFFLSLPKGRVDSKPQILEYNKLCNIKAAIRPSCGGLTVAQIWFGYFCAGKSWSDSLPELPHYKFTLPGSIQTAAWSKVWVFKLYFVHMQKCTHISWSPLRKPLTCMHIGTCTEHGFFLTVPWYFHQEQSCCKKTLPSPDLIKTLGVLGWPCLP